MKLYLFNFKKRENSTKRPSLSSGKSYNILLKSKSTTMNPSIEVQSVTDPYKYNYCYIAELQTYYYINNWEYDRNVWTAHCSEDVLATYKTDIGNSELYVLRSASSYDNDLIDNFYPLKPSHELKRVDTTLTAWKENLEDGEIVVRLWSGGREWNKLNSIVFTPTQFSHFMEAIFPQSYDITDLATWQSVQNYVLQAIGDGINSLIYDPVQYIQSIKWYPFKIEKGATKYYTLFGTWLAKWQNTNPNYSQLLPDIYGDSRGEVQTGVGSYNCMHYELKNPTQTWNAQINIPKRSSNTHRGRWSEQEPFAEYYLYNKLWGIIKLDSNLLAYSQGAINIKLTVDLITGMATLIASAIDTDGVNSNILFTRTQNVGVDIGINGDKGNEYAASLTQNVVGGVGNALTGNYPGLVGNAIESIGSFLHTLGPADVSNVSYSTFASIDNTFSIYGIFYDLAEEDIALNGRPLRKKKKISTLSGYTLVQDGSVNIAGTLDEQTKIKSYLEGGFFYE